MAYISVSTLLTTLALLLVSSLIMSFFTRRNHFPVTGKTILLTGGSQGAGKEVARQLAQKGANVVIVARTQSKLDSALAYIEAGAVSKGQRFTSISADLSSASECARIVDECASWNGGPPDILWCSAGAATPGLFADTATAELDSQMQTNYFSSAYTAHAALQHWLGRKGPVSRSADAHHIVFTSSFLALYPIAGYIPYSPAKAALRSLHDSLSMELEMYNCAGAAAFPGGVKPPPVKVHTLYPATIYSEGFEREQSLKTDLAIVLEGTGEEGQTPEQVAKIFVRGLERGYESVDTVLMTSLVRASVLGASKRVGGWLGFDTLLSWVMALFGIMMFVRADMDAKTRRFGRDFGITGMKEKQ